MTQNGNLLRILVVEDHGDTRAMMEAFLISLGHRVTLATSLREGVSALATEVFDVLLSDIGLPDGYGWDLPPKAREGCPLYAIAMSGFSTPADYEKSQAAGFRHHLLKPLDFDQLEGILYEVNTERHLREKVLPQSGIAPAEQS